ncbi:hypothetical protein [Lactococcus fujiensis]|uniref:WxL domain-containing protein n=1 Tax=Lactococcus fujiensis JCM 16395 TaxID=1291764 RepID=A0A2A5RPV1_9LACT|nr:hypothetical protein [Lactococcus fujiensis]PCS01467.1 hypothetical protein RT41_GL000231 [Lactococcus fujiensis JCM 16395]
MKKTSLLITSLALLFGLIPIVANADTVSGTTGSGTATITLTPGTLQFISVPDFTFGSQAVGVTSVTSTALATGALTVGDYSGGITGYNVTAQMTQGFTNGTSTLVTPNFTVSLGNSEDGALTGISGNIATTSTKIASGAANTSAGQEATIGGDAQLTITNASGTMYTQGNYSATIDYTLGVGI